MAITNTQAIEFTNQVVRPMAEKFRGLKAEVDSALATYNGGVGDIFYNNTGATIEDGRESEGVSRLTGNDVLLLITQLQAYQTQLNASGVPAVISKPCVRALRAE